MELCNNGHAEIVHDSHPCPLCVAQDKISDLEKEIEILEAKLEEKENNEVR